MGFVGGGHVGFYGCLVFFGHLGSGDVVQHPMIMSPIPEEEL